MKATGIVRKVDELGRVVLPVELRKTFDIKKEDPLEIYVDGDSIILKKYEPASIFSGDAKNVKRIHEKIVCENCIAEMKSL
jgi:transcriptional pleiotropic regulator of transition state genes